MQLQNDCYRQRIIATIKQLAQCNVAAVSCLTVPNHILHSIELAATLNDYQLYQLQQTYDLVVDTTSLFVQTLDSFFSMCSAFSSTSFAAKWVSFESGITPKWWCWLRLRIRSFSLHVGCIVTKCTQPFALSNGSIEIHKSSHTKNHLPTTIITHLHP